MVLEEEQIRELIKKPANKDLLDVARRNSKLLHMYVTGEGLRESIGDLPYFEKDELTKIRRRLTRSTIDVMERLLEPISKVFTAKGGSEMYGLSQSQESDFKTYLSTVRRGLSLKDWIQFVALRAKLLDPMSLTFNEIDANGKPYPTYKSTNSIHDYALNGRQPEYVIFELTQGEIAGLVQAGIVAEFDKTARVFRVVDDAFDRIAVMQEDAVTFSVAYPNYFGKVPAKVNGDRIVYNSDLIESDLAPVIDLVADFYNDNSSKSLFKKFQMHAKEWGISVTCRACDGEKVLNGETCTACNGTGEGTTKVAQKLAIAIGEDGTAKVPMPPGGFIVPPIEAADMINQELANLRKDITDTFWTEGQQVQTQGLNAGTDGGNKTATEVVMSERHKEPKLKRYSKWAQDLHKFIADCDITILYPNLNPASSVVYGDRYLLQMPEELTTFYETLRAQKAPIAILDAALIDLIDGKFSGNPFQQQKQMILMRVEPFVHFNKSEVMMWQTVSDELKTQKLLYDEWLASKQDIEIVQSTPEKLRVDLKNFATQYYQPAPSPVGKGVAA